jgi:hypothetical protein
MFLFMAALGGPCISSGQARKNAVMANGVPAADRHDNSFEFNLPGNVVRRIKSAVCRSTIALTVSRAKWAAC